METEEEGDIERRLGKEAWRETQRQRRETEGGMKIEAQGHLSGSVG